MTQHPIYQLLSARLACVEAGINSASPWFYGNREPAAERIIRQWAADHAGRVIVEERTWGFVVDHAKLVDSIVSWYPTYERPADAKAAS